MFGIADYGAFVAAIVLFLLIPGPGNLALITSTSKGGVRGGLAATMGVIAGDQVLMWAAVAGVAALLATYPTAFNAVQWLGAAYLAWLGFKMLTAKPGAQPILNIQPRHYFKQAGLITLLNPKAIVFYMAFFPLFVDPARHQGLLTFGVMAATVAVLTFLYGLVAVLLHERGHGPGNLALIEGLAARGANGAQGARCSGKAKQLAHLRRAAPGQEAFPEPRLRLQLGRACGPFLLDHGRHQVAALCDLGGRLHQRVKGQLAEALVQGHPGADGARHGDGVHAPARRLVLATIALVEVLGRPALRCAAAGVEPVQLLAIPEDAEGVRAQAVAHRLDDGHGRRRRNGRVHRVAACPQHAQAGRRPPRVGGGHGIAREHGHPPGVVGIAGSEGRGRGVHERTCLSRR